MSIDARWAWAFLDTPAEQLTGTIDFWTRATGTRTSPWRGEDGEFTTLLPLDGGRPWLKAQRLASGAAGVHLDLDVDDPDPATAVATGLGATGPVRSHVDAACSDRPTAVEQHVALGAEIRDVHPFWTVMADPTGRVYCLTDRDPVTGSLPG